MNNSSFNVPYPIVDTNYLIQPSDNNSIIIEKDGIFVANATLNFSLFPFSTYPVLQICASTSKVNIDAKFIIFDFNIVHPIIHCSDQNHKKALEETVTMFVENNYHLILEDYKNKNTSAVYHIFYIVN